MDIPDGEHPNMSVIPYDSNRDIVLRNANSIVVRDPHSKQLIRQESNRRVEVRSDQRGQCPTCHRAWPHDPTDSDNNEDAQDLGEQPNFIDQNYFQMLAQSLPGSAQPSAPPSPRRRLVQPVRTRAAVAREALPIDAELLGSSPAPPSQAHGISETAFSPKYFEKFFVVEKELGRGGRGVVLLVKHLLEGVTLGHFACKRVPIGDDHAWLEKVLIEVQLLQTLSHQNLVSYRHVWLEDYQLSTFGPSVPCAFILQQYCNGGDLHNFICGPAQASTTTQELKERIRRRSKGESEIPRKPHDPKKLQLEQIYSFFRDITAGLRFLHQNKFVHRDLKPSNCLLHTTGHDMRVLVSDFGEVQYEYATRKSTGATGTISYCAPEVLQRISPGGPLGNFTFKSDIFSLGMILYFLCFANLPYRCANVLHEEREDVDELRAEITSWQGFDDQKRLRPELPDQLYDFLKRLLSINPDHRPTTEEVNRGMETGRLERLPELHRRNSVSSEELTPGRRVQPVDSPMREVSPSKGDRQQSGSSTFSQVLPAHLRRRQASKDPASMDGRMSRSRSQESDSAKIARQDVILRSNATSPVPSPRQTQSPSPLGHAPLLLSPPPPATVRNRAALYLTLRVSSSLVRISLLCVKLVSLLQPCIWDSSSINPMVVYPMMMLAIFEATKSEYRVWQAMIAVAAHTFVLMFVMKTGTLCSRPNGGGGLWEMDERR